MQKLQILLDEHLEVRLKLLFNKKLDVYTIKDKKWQGKLNGDLLQLMVKNGIDVFITNEKNLRYQQNINELPLIFIELNSKTNTYIITLPVIVQINKYLLSNKFRQQEKTKLLFILFGIVNNYFTLRSFHLYVPNLPNQPAIIVYKI
jgi:hypothetical protein